MGRHRINLFKNKLARTLNKRGRSKFAINLKLDKVDWKKVEKIFSTERKETLARFNKEKNLINPRTKDILLLLAGGAVFGLSLVVPALPIAIAPFLIDRNRYKQGLLNQTFERLRKQKLVEIVYKDGEPIVKITKEGKVRALRYKLTEMTIKKPKIWDKRWRLVIFDIPEKYKRVREIFRQHLKAMDFYPLQKSVWVHPYPCFDEIEFLRQIYGLGIDVTYIVAEKIEDSDFLKERYQL